MECKDELAIFSLRRETTKNIDGALDKGSGRVQSEGYWKATPLKEKILVSRKAISLCVSYFRAYSMLVALLMVRSLVPVTVDFRLLI